MWSSPATIIGSALLRQQAQLTLHTGLRSNPFTVIQKVFLHYTCALIIECRFLNGTPIGINQVGLESMIVAYSYILSYYSQQFAYQKIANFNTSCLEAHAGIFRLLMKEIFDPYMLRPFNKKLIS